jgi:hypothetical protein
MEFENSPLFISEDEEKRCEFNAQGVLDTGEIPSAASIKVYELTGETDVTSTILKAGTTVVTSTGCIAVLKSATPGSHYRVEVLLTTNYNKIEGFLILHGAGMKKTA